MKLLLHTCCAPCLIYPYEQLVKEGFTVTGLFYNPNIHPLGEYRARLDAVIDYSKKNNIVFENVDYNPTEFFRAVNMFEDKENRCKRCWQLRLKKTALLAKKKGLKYFTSTLLVSPYQDIEILKSLGEEISKETAVRFLYRDFRPGFRAAHDQAKREGIYCQKYCGCIYSEIERYKNKK